MHSLILVRAKQVIDVEDIIVVIVVIPIIMGRLARFGQNPPWIAGRFVTELWVTNMVRVRNVRRQLPQWLENPVTR